jgi:MFS family permease
MGMMFAVMYSTLESWLQGKSPDSMRGQILAFYSMIQYAGMAIGNVLFGLAEPQSHVLFSLAAVALCLAILPLSLSQQATPAGPTSHSLRLGWLFRSSPVGFVVSLFVGLGSGPFWSLTPVYGATIGLTAPQVATLMTAITLGSALCQYPAGRLSDRMDRRIVLVGLFGVAIAIGAGVWLFGATMGFVPLLVAMFALGGAMTSPYYIAAAHANDRVEAKDTVTIASALLFLYCVGAIIGPLTATAVVAWLGPGGLYAHNLVCQCAVVVFILARMVSSPRPVARDYPPAAKPL